MAKKKQTKVEVETLQEETVVIEQPIVEAPKSEVKQTTKRIDPTFKKAVDGWEIKDRIYRLVSTILMKKKVMKENLSTVKTKEQYL